jgi:hypothetical protein
VSGVALKVILRARMIMIVRAIAAPPEMTTCAIANPGSLDDRSAECVLMAPSPVSTRLKFCWALSGDRKCLGGHLSP